MAKSLNQRRKLANGGKNTNCFGRRPACVQGSGALIMRFPVQSGAALSESSVLSKVYIAAPCPVSWDSMTGDQQVRFCDLCKLNVYNFSKLTTRQAEDLVLKTGGRLCGRIYRRADGTILTDNCPVGLRGLRDKLWATWACAAIALILIGVLQPGHAQGLVGAPVDGRFGMSGEVGFKEQVQSDSPLVLLAAFCFLKLAIPICDRQLWWDRHWDEVSFWVPLAVGFAMRTALALHEGGTSVNWGWWIVGQSSLTGLLFGTSCMVTAWLYRKYLSERGTKVSFRPKN